MHISPCSCSLQQYSVKIWTKNKAKMKTQVRIFISGRQKKKSLFLCWFFFHSLTQLLVEFLCFLRHDYSKREFIFKTENFVFSFTSRGSRHVFFCKFPWVQGECILGKYLENIVTWNVSNLCSNKEENHVNIVGYRMLLLFGSNSTCFVFDILFVLIFECFLFTTNRLEPQWCQMIAIKALSVFSFK